MSAEKTEKYLQIFKDVHGDRYNYDKFLYIGSKGKSIITCKIHGDFRQTVHSHGMGRGCPACANLLRNSTTKHTFTTFLAKANTRHEGVYKYIEESFVDMRTKMSIVCDAHGEFQQTPEAHLTGRGCPKCGNILKNLERTSTFDDFYEKALKVHKIQYSYDRESFVGLRTKMKMFCPIHGLFEQKPKSHLAGNGCRSCAKHGYNPDLAGFLYVLKSGNVTKVGITNLSAIQRAKSVSSSAKKKFEVVTYIKFSDGEVAGNIETELLRYLRDNYSKTSETHEGHSECFDEVDYDTLQKVILKLCSKFLPTLY